MEIHFRLDLLGTPQVSSNRQAVRGFKSRKALALLCYLAARAQPLPRSHLADLFWGDKPEAQGRANLSRVLNNLTTLFPNSILANRDTLSLAPGAFSLDILDFQARQAQGTADALLGAVALYHDEFMSGLYLNDCPEFELWLVEERERWQQRMVSVLECLAGHYARRAQPEKALPFAARLLDLQPWHEEAHRELMRLLWQTGQRSAALQQYETARRVLEQELGVEPSPETWALYYQIRDAQPKVVSAPVAPHNLPAYLTSFVGRETELARIAARLNNPDCRLLTLVGAGGSGKTRLAVEAARTVAHSFRDGIWFVPLAPIGVGQTELLLSAIARVLEVRLAEENDKTLLLEYLRSKQLLLMLDNFEHLREGSGLVIELLQSAPSVKILVTARESLELQAEWIMHLEGLNYPAAEHSAMHAAEIGAYSAVQLFAERARQVNERFELDAETVPHVVRLTQVVEGLPLALELAASRMRMLRVDEIRAQVEKNIDVLSTTMRDVEQRHSSLRAVLDWSYAALSSAEQNLFQVCSVFAGSWSVEAAEYVAAETESAHKQVPALLDILSGKSLVVRLNSEGPVRYRMLEPVRQYAYERLTQVGRVQETRDRHLEYFAEWGQRITAEPFWWTKPGPLGIVQAEIDNLQSALDWSENGDPLDGICLLDFCSEAWQALVQTNLTVLHRVKFLVPRMPQIPHNRPGGLAAKWMAWVAFHNGDIDEAKRWLQEKYEIAQEIGDRELESLYWYAYTVIAFGEQDSAASLRFADRALQLAHESGDLELLADMLRAAGMAYSRTGELETGRVYLMQSLEISNQHQDKQGAMATLVELTRLVYTTGDHAAAEAFARQNVELARADGNPYGVADTLTTLGDLEIARGDAVSGGEHLRASLEYFRRVGELYHFFRPLEAFARLAVLEKQPGRAVKLYGAAHVLREKLVRPASEWERQRIETQLQELRLTLDPTTFADAWTEGTRMTQDRAFEYLQKDEDVLPKSHLVAEKEPSYA